MSLTWHLRELFSSPKSTVTRAVKQYTRAMDSLQDEVEEEQDAFLLDPGMGPMLYLTAGGVSLRTADPGTVEGLREATDAKAIAALITGAEKAGIKDLIVLLPRQPDDGTTCPMCAGNRRAAPVAGFDQPKLICLVCGGLGWVVQAMLARLPIGVYGPRATRCVDRRRALSR
jgi:hypothetical protein